MARINHHSIAPAGVAARHLSQVVLTTIVFACSSSALGQKYVVTDLGSLSGPISQAFDVNASGQVVGSAWATPGGDHLHAFRWDGSMTDVGTLGGDPQSVAFSINDAGAVVGVSYALGELQPRAFRWINGSIANLGAFTPHKVNSAGDVAGFRTIASGKAGIAWQDRACVLVNGGLTTLGTLGGTNSYAVGINDRGEVVGSSQVAGDQTSHAFFWNGGGLTDLGTLGGAMSQAYAINASRKVVGVSETAGGQMHAFRYALDSSGNVTQRDDLHDLANGGSCAYAINDAGVAVGSSNGRAVIWKSTGIVDLNTRISNSPGWVLDAATGINAGGIIVGYGRHDGIPRAFLLTPTIIVVTWNALATNGQYTGRTLVQWDAFDGAAEYQVQRKMISGGSFEVIADHIAGTRCNDRDAAKCQRYRYRVRARGSDGTFLSISGSDVGWRGSCAGVLLRIAPDPAVALPDAPMPERAADLDGNGCVNAADLVALTGALGDCERCAADLDGDGRVNAADLALLLADWDSTPSP